MLLNMIQKLVEDRKGGTAIEYGLIAALVVITMVASFVELANTTTGMWSNVNSKIETARTGG
ncbi:Flp family type IVb pilin [Sphingomonas sp. QA11]|jgi:pilus assembly protein Flp/PilA|uniref:Flp pilus assembly protein, pilin Flp n=1 Tax=hydrothermal vent metagenome TaxID=652676 RepID=A0A160TQN8_9ZZZZ|nr:MULTISPECIES: Flp family type IVb pilin [unclassified Sphingomonas]WCM28658.1 Flp family type IVb pilin [Sphingomonas sp. QA11]WEK01014.1 MAG: Flp family type IVb pilin [Sphingomonas sp.]